MKIIDRILDFVTKKPFLIIGILLVISTAMFPGVLKLEQDNDFHGYLNPNADMVVKIDYLDELFHATGSTLFVAIESENIYDYDVLRYVEKIHHRIENEIEETDEVTSIINIKDIDGKNDELTTYHYIEKDDNGKPIIPKTKEELQKLRLKVESNDKYEAFIISNVKNNNGIPASWNIIIELIEIEIYDEVINEIENILVEVANNFKSEKKNIKTYFAGEAHTLKEINIESRSDLNIQIPLIIIVICIIYLLNFKSLRGVILPLLTNLIAGLWTFSIIGYAGVKLSIIGLLLIPLLQAVGSSYAIHSLNQYYKECHTFSEKNLKHQITIAMEHILKTIFIAGLTTAISLSSLTVSSIVHLRTFGFFAATGVVISVLLSLSFIPAVLSLLPIPEKHKEKNTFDKGLFDKVLEKIIKFIIKQKRIVFIAILIIIIIGAIGIFFVSTASTPAYFFTKEHKVRSLLKYFGENFDGVSTMDIVIDAYPEGDFSIDKEIAKVKKRIEKNTNNTESIEDPFQNDNTESIEDPFENDNTEDIKDPFRNDNTESIEDPFDNDNTESIEDPFQNDNGTNNDLNDLFTNNNDNFENDVNIQNFNKELNHALSVDLFEKIEDLQEYTQSIEGVGRCYSFVDIQKRFHYAMHNNNPDYERIPESDQVLIDYMSMFTGDDDNEDGIPDVFESFIDPTKNRLRISMKLKNVGDRLINSGDYHRIQTQLDKYIQKHFDTDEIDYYFTGGAILHKHIQYKIVQGQLYSIAFSLLIIAVLMAIIFRSVRIGIISLIPLLCAVIINFGIMGYTGIVLNIGTSLISAFAIGIGIDDTVHFMLHLRKYIDIYIKKHGSIDKSHIDNIIYDTLKYSNKAIIFTSLALIFGFMVVIFSTFLPIRHFAILVAITMITATISTLVFLPSLILNFPRFLLGKKFFDNK